MGAKQFMKSTPDSMQNLDLTPLGHFFELINTKQNKFEHHLQEVNKLLGVDQLEEVDSQLLKTHLSKGFFFFFV